MADLCVCKGDANKKIQELICNSVLSERNRDIFMKTELGPRLKSISSDADVIQLNFEYQFLTKLYLEGRSLYLLELSGRFV